MVLQICTKDDLIEKALELEYFDKDLQQITCPHRVAKGGGLYAHMMAEQNYDFEYSLVKKLKMVREVIENEDTEASIDEYVRLTEQPDTNHPLYDQFKTINKFAPQMKLDSFFIPMDKGEFEIYLEVYNTVFKQAA